MIMILKEFYEKNLLLIPDQKPATFGVDTRTIIDVVPTDKPNIQQVLLQNKDRIKRILFAKGDAEGVIARINDAEQNAKSRYMIFNG